MQIWALGQGADGEQSVAQKRSPANWPHELLAQSPPVVQGAHSWPSASASGGTGVGERGAAEVHVRPAGDDELHRADRSQRDSARAIHGPLALPRSARTRAAWGLPGCAARKRAPTRAADARSPSARSDSTRSTSASSSSAPRGKRASCAFSSSSAAAACPSARARRARSSDATCSPRGEGVSSDVAREARGATARAAAAWGAASGGGGGDRRQRGHRLRFDRRRSHQGVSALRHRHRRPPAP